MGFARSLHLPPRDLAQAAREIDWLDPDGKFADVEYRRRRRSVELHVRPSQLDSVQAVTAYGTSHRLFTEGQRLILVARDRGCCLPGCTAPPALIDTRPRLP